MFRTGASLDPPGRAGLASITAEMLDEGAGTRDALAIAADLEQLGSDLWVASGRDGSQLSVQAPRETFNAAMAIAADVLARPRLEDSDWQRVHNDRRTGVVQRRDQPRRS
jgi:predicted Zn-dependent peptidase